MNNSATQTGVIDLRKQIEFTRIDNDINGNPRYVCHFLNLVSEAEDKETPHGLNRINILYSAALYRSKQLGGKKYNNKKYGGGIVFQSNNIRRTEQEILSLVNA